MRGGGTNATRQSYDYNYDHFGTSKWRTVSGKYALACDSLDMMGNVFDYNGVQEGVGDGERFTLKIRAFKEPSWLKDPKYKDIVLCNADEVDKNGKVVKKVRSRGLFDTFILPYAYFLLNRKKFMVRCTTTVAQVADIPNHWQEWWNIGGMKCLIDRFVLSDLEDKQLFYDSKSNLQELIQGKLKKEFHYELLEESGPEHNKTFRVSVWMTMENISGIRMLQRMKHWFRSLYQQNVI